MLPQIFKALILAVLLAAGGCASIPESYVLPKEDFTGTEPSIVVADMRPEVEKVMRVEESPHLFIIRYGDSNFSANRIEMLRMRIQKELGLNHKNVRIEVTRFESTVSRPSIGIGGGPTRPQTTYIVTKPDGSIPGHYAAGSAFGNALGTMVINSDWFRSTPSTFTYPSTMIQGTVNGVSFLGNNNASVKAYDLSEGMPKVIDEAILTAIRNIKRQLGPIVGDRVR